VTHSVFLTWLYLPDLARYMYMTQSIFLTWLNVYSYTSRDPFTRMPWPRNLHQIFDDYSFSPKKNRKKKNGVDDSLFAKKSRALDPIKAHSDRCGLYQLFEHSKASARSSRLYLLQHLPDMGFTADDITFLVCIYFYSHTHTHGVCGSICCSIFVI